MQITKTILMLLFIYAIECNIISTAQENVYNLLKFGLKGNTALTNSNHLNYMSNDWIDDVADISNTELTRGPLSLPFNIEYGFQPFFIIRPIKPLQLGAKMDFAYSNLLAKFENSLFCEDYQLKINTKSSIPGVFVYLVLEKFEIGGGVIQSFTRIKINDDFFGYNDRWYGENTGYEISLGFSSSNSKEKHFGFTMNCKYRGLKINNFEDTYKRQVIQSDTQENLSVNMSGFVFEIGLYLQFIKLQKTIDIDED